MTKYLVFIGEKPNGGCGTVLQDKIAYVNEGFTPADVCPPDWFNIESKGEITIDGEAECIMGENYIED